MKISVKRKQLKKMIENSAYFLAFSLGLKIILEKNIWGKRSLFVLKPF